MPKPCITIDVSKGTSHIQGFIDSPDNPICKPFKIDHTLKGFNYINVVFERLVKETNQKPLIIFEYTGVYHRTLVSYLEREHYEYHPVSPLKSSKTRNKEIRNAKTDKRDCKNLAMMFYDDDLGIFLKQDKVYLDLKDLNREYNTNKIHLQKLEVTLNELIDTIYPGLRVIFSDYLSKLSLMFLKTFYHPELIINKSNNEIIDFFKNSGIYHTDNYWNNKVKEIKTYVSSIISGCSKDSYTTQFLIHTVNQLTELLKIQDEVKQKITELAESTPYITILESFPGIGTESASRLIAELGDISRFKSANSINAFVGIDPLILQSGKMSGEHLKISKKGHKIARSILFLIVRSMIRRKVPDNVIKTFYYKKKAQPNVPPKVALFASMNKLIRLIYSLCKSGEIYTNSITQ